MKSNIAHLRQDYMKERLDEQDMQPGPLDQFHRWFEEARLAEIPEPNAMILSTADAQGRPCARTLLLKEYDDQGFVFFTNYESRKGLELAENPQACMLFMWLELQRQVRIEGRVEKVSAEESDAYFLQRPLGSRWGAHASPQSRVIAGREVLEETLKAVQEQFGDTPPRPAHWGGYRVIPEKVEFWQGRPSRLHDRLVYVRESEGWKVERLAP
ncbi:MAG: pyridoxamine 5'-phosphate oxidase [Fluviicoccus sp.]|uniref:pyridoxamine 5'-phosphate oxidase n=1 Tax=Fluviicoccus sp. TaxID=2003552 RepID=UPI00271597D0|nr:pyridoxamine 5'-phosphate oxidase [Fluviicoccus sp.]MDO8329857.1 pyridoxamine 5'-phosphate oxidase [Fluviicoccus sp.]